MTILLGISGSLTAGGSTRKIVDVTLQAAKTKAPDITTDVIDLREVKISFCDGRPPEEYPDDTASVLERIQAADAYIIGTPIYRGSYTGALKNLLDHIPVEAFMGKVAGLVGNAYTDHHYLSIDQELKPVLAWFNMHIVPGSVYVRADQMQDGAITDDLVQDHLRQLGEAVIGLCQSLKDSPQGPPPLVLWPRKKS
jgi:NAD(P)H-dependent FMN reductase